MRLGWLLIVLSVGLVAAAAEDDAEDARGEGGKYLVYKKTTYKGEESYRIIKASAWRDKIADVAKVNKVSPDAYKAAREAWEKDKRNKGIRFPMRVPKRLRLQKMSTYSARLKAEDAAWKRQEKLDLRAERLKDREERRLSRLTEAQRKRQKEEADALRRAERLYERKLEELLAALDKPKEEKAKVEEKKPASD